jgi:hypothetical protein
MMFAGDDEPHSAPRRPTAMNRRRILPAILLALLAIAPARATDSHDYAKGEYAVIRGGLAPDNRKSLASHADPDDAVRGDAGNHFHVWLMAEPAHRRLATLPDIGSDNNLDTGPDAYRAHWSADSRHVAVGFRSDRHQVQLNLYRIDGGRARLVDGPSLFKEVSSREVGGDDRLAESVAGIEWRGPNRFVLREHRVFLAKDDGILRRLGAFGRVTDKTDDGRLLVDFYAEADCVLLPDGRYRIVDLRREKSGDGATW